MLSIDLLTKLVLGSYLLAKGWSKINQHAYLISPRQWVKAKSCIRFMFKVGEEASNINSLVVKITSVKEPLTGQIIWKNVSVPLLYTFHSISTLIPLDIFISIGSSYY